MAHRIFAIGETVLDIIFKDGKPITSTPGGSMLNTAVSLGRLGLEVYFISEYGCDEVGGIVDGFLYENGVNSSYVYRYTTHPTSLALAFLDERNNAKYQFYKHYPQQRLAIDFPELTSEDIVVFGSFYGIDPIVHIRLKPFLEQAHKQGALIVYDPNFRTSHLAGIDTYKPIMLSNFSLADMVKGSNEDFAYIFGTEQVEDTYRIICEMSPVLVYTANKDDVNLCMPGIVASFDVPSITPLSTIGAGDTFTAGLIYSLVKQNIHKNDLGSMRKAQRENMIRTAIEFSGHVCMGYENYLSQEYANDWKIGK